MVKIVVFQGNDGQWYYRRVATNGEPVGTSEGYTRKASAKRAAQKEADVWETEVTVID
jgi:uncharacterized protein YegP (UPF0339 family)